MVSVDDQLFSVTNAYRGELVDVFVDGSVIHVWSKNHLIRTVARARDGRIRKVRAEGYTSMISRTQNVKHQLALDRGHLTGGTNRCRASM
jgi:hypothetical protein